MRVGDVVAQAGRGDDLDVGAPLQDPQPDLDRARDRRPPAQRAVGVGLERLGRMPGRLAHAACDARREAQDDLDLRLVGDDVPGRPELGGRGCRVRRLERPRCQRRRPDPLDLERPDRAALLVEADQVERVGLERRLEEVRPDRRPPRGRARLVVGRRVVDGHDAPLGPGLGQEPDVGAETLVARRLREAVQGAFDVLRQAASGRPRSSFSNAAARSGSYLSA